MHSSLKEPWSKLQRRILMKIIEIMNNEENRNNGSIERKERKDFYKWKYKT